ncbi:MPR1 [Coprinopsis cinerea okayama7|uniref:MPR1 n=1 Tax=Coprinopsis cinerea (strain Okayama-7 / 130 / ATCC MYA-4618 / FGSC 9003) TaxID=240176 RepID=D6RLL8_COPC7|nr:MPR1 [Coprinopsis cinerea okayama7\|eukprot:XP_002911624.1 MPR1 [Coprinopsis cinerea okayama7\
MSAYGEVKRSQASVAPLPSTFWRTSLGADSKGAPETIAVHHLTLQIIEKYDALLDYLREVFAAVVEEGRTYPQEGDINEKSFQSYFFAADVFVGVAVTSPSSQEHQCSDGALTSHESLELASKDWRGSVSGFYYVKPNYPGRSSHICNAGFVVPPVMRGRRYGKALAKSYLHYAPKLGYKASVFNLVYVNNVASVRIWDSLGFTRAGLIPGAGRLKRQDGDGEEYVDALVFYKRFSN